MIYLWWFLSISATLFLFSFCIYFIRFQKSRCRYSKSKVDDHKFTAWTVSDDYSFQYRRCQVCNFHESKAL